MKKIMYRSSRPQKQEEQKALIGSVYWYSPFQIRKMFLSIVGSTIICSGMLLAKMDMIAPVLVVIPSYLCLILSTINHLNHIKYSDYKAGYFVTCMAGVSLCLMIFSISLILVLYFLKISSTVYSVCLILVVYILLFLYSAIMIRHNAHAFIQKTLNEYFHGDEHNKDGSKVFLFVLVGSVLGSIIVRAGLAVIGVLIGVYVGIFLIAKLIAPRFATYINLDMLCALKAELEEEAQGDVPPAEDDPNDKPT